MKKIVVLLVALFLLVITAMSVGATPNTVPYIPEGGIHNCTVTVVWPGNTQPQKGTLFLKKAETQQKLTVAINWVKAGPGAGAGIYESAMPPSDGTYVIEDGVVGGQYIYTGKVSGILTCFDDPVYMPLLRR